jgi:DNA-binding FrmR family transcriptional regulator
MGRVTHYDTRKPDLLSRLRKAEGQVRGLQQMIEADRYCLDVLHQVEAAVAALREVSGIALESHLDSWAQDAAAGKATPADLKEIAGLLRRRMK